MPTKHQEAEIESTLFEAETMIKRLTEMSSGEAGSVASIEAGDMLHQRLESLGVRVGKAISKASAQWFNGPVVLIIDKRRVALGFGSAQKIMVEVAE